MHVLNFKNIQLSPLKESIILPFKENEKFSKYIFATTMPNEAMRGDYSHKKIILENDIVVIDLEREAKLDDIVFAKTKIGYVIRKLTIHGNYQILQPLNIQYPLIQEGFEVEGVVIKVFSIREFS